MARLYAQTKRCMLSYNSNFLQDFRLIMYETV